MKIIIDVSEENEFIKFDMTVDDKETTHASIGVWSEDSYRSMCHLFAVTVHANLLGVKIPQPQPPAERGEGERGA